MSAPTASDRPARAPAGRARPLAIPAPAHRRGPALRRAARGLLGCLLLCAAGAARAQDLGWLRGALGDSSGVDLASDAAGHVYVVGRFAGGALTLSAGQPDERLFTGPPGHEAFLAKYDRDGSLLWVRAAALAAAVAVDAEANLYVTGAAAGSVTLGEGGHRVELSGDADGDVLVAKYDRDGTLLWARLASGAGRDAGTAIAVDGRGRVQVTGGFAGTLSLGEGEPGHTLLHSSAERAGFLASYSEGGALLGARSVPSAPDHVALDAAGNTYLTGAFEGSAQFGSGPSGPVELRSAGWTDAFVVKYDPQNTPLWARGGGGPSFDWSHAVAPDALGNVYVSGAFEGSAVFGAGGPNEVELHRGGISPFFARYDAAGELQWVRSVSGSDDKLVGTALALDAAGALYTAGHFLGTITLGEGEENETVLSAPGLYPGPEDIFVAKFLPSGALAWARQAHGPQARDLASAIAIDPLHGLYVTGYGLGTVVFGAGEPRETALITRSPFEASLFLARYQLRNPTSGDYDNDAVADGADNCPRLENPDQADRNGDGLGDACVPPESLERGAVLGPDALIGPGSRLARQVVLGAHATVGLDVVIERNVRAGEHLRIGSRARIGRDVHFGERVQVGSGAVIERGAHIGSRVVIGERVTLGRDAVIEDGARIGAGTALGAQATLGAGAAIADETSGGCCGSGLASGFGRGLILGPGARIEAPVQVGRDVAIGPRALVLGHTEIGRGATVAQDAQVESLVRIEEFATVRPGAIVPTGTQVPRGSVFP